MNWPKRKHRSPSFVVDLSRTVSEPRPAYLEKNMEPRKKSVMFAASRRRPGTQEMAEVSQHGQEDCLIGDGEREEDKRSADQAEM